MSIVRRLTNLARGYLKVRRSDREAPPAPPEESRSGDPVEERIPTGHDADDADDNELDAPRPPITPRPRRL